MKNNILILVAVSLLIPSCGRLIKKTIPLDQAIQEKIKIEEAQNPAKKYVINNELQKKKINIENVVVKDVIASSNIDYDFCVLVDASTEKGKVECFIYSNDVKKIAKLIKGETRISVTGEFARFFTLIDDYYTKIELVDARIKIRQ